MDYKALITEALQNNSRFNHEIKIDDVCIGISVCTSYHRLFRFDNSKFIAALFDYNKVIMCIITINCKSLANVVLKINAEIIVESGIIDGDIICTKARFFTVNNNINAFDAKFHCIHNANESDLIKYVFHKVECYTLFHYNSDRGKNQVDYSVLRNAFPNVLSCNNTVILINHIDALFNTYLLKCANQWGNFVVTVVNKNHDLFASVDIDENDLLTTAELLAKINQMGLTLADNLQAELIVDSTKALILTKQTPKFHWKKLIKNACKY